MSHFHTRLRAFIQEAGYDYRSLSLAIGQGERYLSNLLNNGNDPGYSTMIKLCAVLGITPNQLAGLDNSVSVVPAGTDGAVSAQADKLLEAVAQEARRKLNRHGVRPTVDELLLWWHQQDGVLRNFDALEPHLDLFGVPDSTTAQPEPVSIGPTGLVRNGLGVTNAEELRRLLEGFTQELRDKVVWDHVRTSQGMPQLSIEQIEVSLPDHKYPARFKYKRLLLPVRDTKGTDFVLNYSQPLE